MIVTSYSLSKPIKEEKIKLNYKKKKKEKKRKSSVW